MFSCGQTIVRSPAKQLPHHFFPSGMAPPPSPANIARPVAVIHTSDGNKVPATTETRALMSSPFHVVRNDQMFSHIQSSNPYLGYSGSSVSPTISGIISPTSWSQLMASSPVTSNKSTARNTPTGPPRLLMTPGVESDIDANIQMMNLAHANQDDNILQEERFLHLMPTNSPEVENGHSTNEQAAKRS